MYYSGWVLAQSQVSRLDFSWMQWFLECCPHSFDFFCWSHLRLEGTARLVLDSNTPSYASYFPKGHGWTSHATGPILDPNFSYSSHHAFQVYAASCSSGPRFYWQSFRRVDNWYLCFPHCVSAGTQGSTFQDSSDTRHSFLQLAWSALASDAVTTFDIEQ